MGIGYTLFKNIRIHRGVIRRNIKGPGIWVKPKRDFIHPANDEFPRLIHACIDHNIKATGLGELANLVPHGIESLHLGIGHFAVIGNTKEARDKTRL